MGGFVIVFVVDWVVLYCLVSKDQTNVSPTSRYDLMLVIVVLVKLSTIAFLLLISGEEKTERPVKVPLSVLKVGFSIQFST